MKDNFIQYLEQNFDSFVDLCKRRKWLALIAACIILYIIFLHFKIYPHMNSLENNLKNLKEDNKQLQTQLAPFLAVANKEFSDQPENKRLELLVNEMDIIEKSINDMQQLIEKQKNHIDTLNEIRMLDSLISEIISDNLVSLKELTRFANDTDYPFNKDALDKFHVAISDL